jgi:hypothetical protein
MTKNPQDYEINAIYGTSIRALVAKTKPELVNFRVREWLASFGFRSTRANADYVVEVCVGATPCIVATWDDVARAWLPEVVAGMASTPEEAEATFATYAELNGVEFGEFGGLGACQGNGCQYQADWEPLRLSDHPAYKEFIK